MCGRFTLTTDPSDLQEAFYWVNFGNATISPRYNIAPTQGIPVVTNNGDNTLDFYTWGLVPFWAKDPSIGQRMINARSETLSEKPSFRNAYKRRRCLILADGFYEWQKIPGEQTKIPMYIQLTNHQPFAFAGIWEEWHSPDGSQILSSTIITTEPNELIQPIHNRMPVILDPETYSTWLLPGETTYDKLNPLLKPYDHSLMTAFPVSRLVNNPRNESPDCIKPQI
jgi:putative SOS response-associated peptidase YedK